MITHDLGCGISIFPRCLATKYDGVMQNSALLGEELQAAISEQIWQSHSFANVLETQQIHFQNDVEEATSDLLEEPATNVPRIRSEFNRRDIYT